MLQAQKDLAAAEAQRNERQEEISAIERRLRFRLGRSLDRLAELEDEIKRYRQEIEQLRIPGALEAGYLPVEEQYRRVWSRSSDQDIYSGAEPLRQVDEQQLKQLFRRLARRYHPDLATDQSERQYRTEKMAALNEAYASGSLVEMVALSEAGSEGEILGDQSGHTDEEMVQVLEKELARIRRKSLLLQNEIETLHNSPVVQLSLDIKLARRKGRDLLGEMSDDLQRRIDRATVERDELKVRLESMRH